MGLLQVLRSACDKPATQQRFYPFKNIDNSSRGYPPCPADLQAFYLAKIFHEEGLFLWVRKVLGVVFQKRPKGPDPMIHNVQTESSIGHPRWDTVVKRALPKLQPK